MDICYCSKFSKCFSFYVFFLTVFKISACRSEEHNNRAKGKEKTEVLFSKVDKMFIHQVTVAIKSGFEQYTNKK